MDQNPKNISAQPQQTAPSSQLVTQQTESSTITQVIKLPSINQLFSESWLLFRKTIWQYLKFLLIGTALIILLVIPLAILPLIFPTLKDYMIVFILVFSVILEITFMPLFTFIMVIVVDSATKVPVWKTVKVGRSFILSILAVTLISGMITGAGTFAFIVPGIAFLVFFTFIPFVVVLERKRMIEALKRSYYLAKAHFWQLFIRLLIISAITLVANFIVSLVPVLGIVSIPVGWFTFVWTYILYKQCLQTTPVNKENISFKWIWIMVGVGLVVMVAFVLSIDFLYKQIGRLPETREFGNSTNTATSNSPTPSPIYYQQISPTQTY